MAANDHQVITAGALTLGAATVTLDGVSMTWNNTVDAVEDTVWGDTYKQRLVGLGDYGGTFEAFNDHTDNELDEDLEALLRTSFAVAWKPNSGAISVTNPEYQFTGTLTALTKTYAHGQVPKVTGTLVLTTSAGVTRDVTP